MICAARKTVSVNSKDLVWYFLCLACGERGLALWKVMLNDMRCGDPQLFCKHCEAWHWLRPIFIGNRRAGFELLLDSRDALSLTEK
jgi:hypothetical protein